MQSKIYLIDITCFLGALYTARNLLLHLRQRRLRLAALMQALAAASRELNCFAALLDSVVVTQSQGFQTSPGPRAADTPHGQ
jgi:hypothetical protein